MVYCVGLTGSIASGKSTLAQLFSALGIDVINADHISKNLSAPGQPAFAQIVGHYGTDILLPNGDLNRRKLRDIIFTEPKERQWLEQLLHPLIRQEIQGQVSVSKSAYCIVEIPLLVDKKNYPYINKILLVDAPELTQIMRVMQRDHCSQEQAMQILKAQPDIELRKENADDFILNDMSIADLKTIVAQLNDKYLIDSSIS